MSVQGMSEKKAWKEWKIQGTRKSDERPMAVLMVLMGMLMCMGNNF